ncbi:S-phase kinase-associated protein 2 isoform X2 [Kryptolebias marmoratus]|uniref:S-phase kinase-associated protein 2 isoform X2 n=1 Tax=Kryptolebias marmoratus TaxID=37003 RepID=UPI0007F928A7|nr:S-phase kinase-associated protein 2 isoform X2 [Kryptolebias marmoratus]
MADDSTVVPLQDLPWTSLRSSRTRTKRRSRSCLGPGLDSECTPTESIQQSSPPRKVQLLVSRGKENRFVLARRSRRRRESASGVSWDHLPEELLLRIYMCLPLQNLLRASGVCRRWHRLAFDDSLWTSVDLEGLTHMGPALQQVLKTRVRRLRCPRAFVEDLQLAGSSLLQIVELDLSGSIIPTSVLQNVAGRCRRLRFLSLEGLRLSDDILGCLWKNPELLQLNLSGCSDVSAAAVGQLLRTCCRLEQLNVSWCSFGRDHVTSVVTNLSPTVCSLNLSGYRDTLTLDDLKLLVDRCPNVQTLDLSDSTLLTADSFLLLQQLKNLLHLSLSRCYHIHLAALSDLGRTLPSLRFLDVFGLVQDNQLLSLKKDMSHISINCRPFSCVARPTPAGRTGPLQPDRSMWGRTCRLRVPL